MSSEPGEEWLITSLAQEDLNILIRESLQRTDHSYYLAVTITSNRLFVNYINGMFGTIWKHHALYKEMLEHSVNSLISDCHEPGISYPITSVARVIQAYSIAFEEVVCTGSSECMDLLQICQPKIESLHFHASGSYEAMKASSYFHNSILSIKCQEAKLITGGCKSLWKHNLLGVGEMLVEVKKVCVGYCDDAFKEVVSMDCAGKIHSSLVVAAFEAYALKEYKKAAYIIENIDEQSRVSCLELESVVIYMMLYDIYSQFQDLEKADQCITSIRGIDFQNSNMTCYTAVYGDTVIPFLKEVNATKLAKELRDLKFDSYMAAIVECEDTLNCNNMRYQTPLLKLLLQFSPLWVGKMLKSDSLFCAVTKEVMLGCDSPFPFFTDILKAQFSFAQVIRENAEIG